MQLFWLFSAVSRTHDGHEHDKIYVKLFEQSNNNSIQSFAYLYPSVLEILMTMV